MNNSRATSALGVRLGQSLSIDLHRCDQPTLANKSAVEAVMVRAAEHSGATVVSRHFHEFSPQGISGVVVITESHFAVHTWPEFGFAAVDLFTCGPSVDFERAIRELTAGFQASSSETVRLERGQLASTRVEIEHLSDSGHVATWREKFEHERARNLTAIIDVFDCAVPCDPSPFIKSLDEFCEPRAFHLPSIHMRTSSTHFTLTSDELSLAGRVDHESRRAYVMVMSSRFFEPRAIAEAAVTHLRGSRYGLQVGVQP